MILVTGATGLVGRPLIDLLVAAGAPVRAITRNAAASLPSPVEVFEGDPSRPDTLEAAFEGVTSVFVNPRTIGQNPDPAVIGEAASRLLSLARKHGVTRVVAMSALNVEYSFDLQPSRLRGEYNKEVEDAVVASGLEWTALRSGFYAMNTIGTWAGQIQAGDIVRGPYADTAWAPLHERDIAAVAAHALLTDDLIGRKPVLTGPQSLTQQEMVATIGEAIGRPLRFEEIPAEVALQGMVRAGIPEVLANGFVRLQADSYLQGNLVSGEVEKFLGRPGLTYAQWATEHAADFR